MRVYNLICYLMFCLCKCMFLKNKQKKRLWGRLQDGKGRLQEK